MKYWCFLLVFTLAFPASAKQHVIRHITHKSQDDFRDSYYADLLKLALQASQQEYGDYSLVPVPVDVFQGRVIELLKRGEQLDVIWTMTSETREQQLLPIRIPLAKGIMGYRLLMIREGTQSLFNHLDERQLKQKLAGQAYDWPDTQILKANGFKVITAPASTLVAMLKAGRFDYFPRGLQEIWDEVDSFDGVEVEDSLLIYYPAPMFFFVNRQNKILAERLEKGLRLVVDRGGQEKLLDEYHFIRDAVLRAKIANRKIITLRNPALSLASRQALDPESTLHAENGPETKKEP
ncbi:hypothetical protein [Neptunicella sp. SCSIO 80796]|uniref:hypothetical protein n=1 Tax=Neptunicella plasticusilytica TaxID=3117012 RepID=UPI003A4DCDF3